METTITQQLSEILEWGPRAAGFIMTLLLFYILVKLAHKAIVETTKKFDLDDHLSLLMIRTSRITLVILGLITALGTLGINVSALVAGLGLTGFALGFAMKDTISNLLSGILILLYQPFKLGDSIEVSGFSGKVATIDLRYTRLSAEDHTILIPNSKLFTDPITVKR